MDNYKISEIPPSSGDYSFYAKRQRLLREQLYDMPKVRSHHLDHFCIYHVGIARFIGIHEAILLDLLDEHGAQEYFISFSPDQVFAMSGMVEKKQAKALHILEKENLIFREFREPHHQRFVKINIDAYDSLLNDATLMP